MTLIQADNGQLIEFTKEKENPMTNNLMKDELPIMQQPLVAPVTPEQQLVAATLSPTANQPAPEAKMPKRTESVEGTLEDGRVFKLRRAKGRDMQNALRITDKPMEQTMVMAASVTEIDGVPLNYEGFLDLDFADCSKILTAFNQLSGN